MEKIELIDIKDLKVFKLHQRADLGNVDDMAVSVKQHGILQPVLVRRVPGNGGNELVYGRRRLAAAKIAGLDAIPAIVRELDDAAALEAALVENLQREGEHPLDEAEGYGRLAADPLNLTGEQIAAKVGKSKAYVYARLKLLALAAPVRKLFREGALDASKALLIARIPDAKVQQKAAKVITDNPYGPVSLRRAQEIIEQQYMLRLEDAPFDTADAKLVEKAGPCSKCPKRTGNQRELFAQAATGGKESPDLCTDAACWQSKVDATWAAKKAEAEKKGLRVLSEKEARAIFPYGAVVDQRKYFDLDAKNYDDPKGRTYGALLGKSVEVAVVQNPHTGAAVRVVEREAAEEALRDKYKWAAQERLSARSPEEKKHAQAYELRKATVLVALGELCNRVKALVLADGSLAQPGLWHFIAGAVLDCADHDARARVMKRRGLKGDDALGKLLKNSTVPELVAISVELLAALDAAGASWSSGYGPRLLAGCKAFTIDLKKIEAKVKAEAKK